jgi:hypothetical protein
LRLTSGHAALLVVHLAQANFAPRALPGLMSDGKAAIIHVLTDPRTALRSLRFIAVNRFYHAD